MAGTITSPTPTTILDLQTSVTITGTSFGASQGSGLVLISPTNSGVDAGAISQSVTSWSDTSITFTAGKGTLKFGTRYLFVKDNAGTYSNGWAITFSPQTGWAYVDLVSVASPPSIRLTSTPDLAIGDEILYGGIVGSGTVAVNNDATFNAAPTVISFDFRVNDGTGWGSQATQQLAPLFRLYANGTFQAALFIEGAMA